jgi:excisionase family DNA binding protein
MSESVLTLEPEVLTVNQPDPSWLDVLTQFVRKAAESGETVTVSSKPKMMTPEQVARGLGVSRSTVSRQIAGGKIRSLKVGNRHRIPYSEYRRVWEESMAAFAQASIADIESELFDE